MILVHASGVSLLGSDLGNRTCALIGDAIATAGHPFRLMWFTPLLGLTAS